jgi:hypothetical protein
MRRQLLDWLGVKALTQKNPTHIGDLGVRWVVRLKCGRLTCSCEWVWLSKEPPDVPELACVRCSYRGRMFELRRTRAIVEVNARAGVGRYQAVEGENDAPYGPWEYFPWDPATLEGADGTWRHVAPRGSR